MQNIEIMTAPIPFLQRCCKNIFIIFVIVCQVLSLSHNHISRYDSLRAVQNKRISSMQAACTRDTIVVITATNQPFHGLVYSKGYPLACHASGNGSQEVKLVLNVTRCGVKIFEDTDGKLRYEVHVYIQFDGTVQQASDDQLLVSCNPIDVIPVASADRPRALGPTARFLRDPAWSLEQTGRKAPLQAQVSRAHLTAEEAAPPPPPPVVGWMDILNGKSGTSGKAIHDYVRVGEEATMLIKIQQQPGLATKVVNCVAHDGTGDAQQELIDDNGCAVESSIMPVLQEKVNSRTGLKFVFAPFAAFKFPDKDNLHLKCQVIVCVRACPLNTPCAPRKGRLYQQRPFSDSFGGFKKEEWSSTPRDGSIVDVVDVFNAFEVRAPQIELDSVAIDELSRDGVLTSEWDENTTCISTSRMILTFGILLGVVIIALVFSVSMFVWGRRNRRLAQKCIHLPYQRPYESYT